MRRRPFQRLDSAIFRDKFIVRQSRKTGKEYGVSPLRIPGARALHLAISTLILLAAAQPAQAYRLYVSCRGSDEVAVIDTNTLSVVTTIPVGESPTYIEVTRDGKYALAVSTGSRMLYVIDTRSLEVAKKLPLGDRPTGISVSPDNRQVYVVNEGPLSKDIYVFDPDTWTRIGIIMTGRAPYNVYFDPTSSIAYVTNGGSNSLSSIDVSTHSIIAELDLEDYGRPQNLAVTPDGIYAVVTDDAKDAVWIILLKAERVTKKLPVSRGSHGVDVSPDGGYVYVSGMGSDAVTVIDAYTWTVVRTIRVGRGPYGVRFAPDGKEAYVAVTGENKVAVIDAERHEIKDRVEVCGHPFWVAVE